MNPADAIAFATLTDPADPRFSSLLALYAAAIPARERKPAADVRDMAASPRHRVDVAYDRGALVGFTLLYLGERLALLEYMAVAEARRGGGLGAALYAAARRAAGPRPLLVEVESDREPVPDRALRARRIGFYRRLGCRRIDGIDYILPLPGDGPPPRLELLVDGIAGDAVAPATMSAWLGDIYAGVYGCPSDDPRLATMRASLPPWLPLA